VSCAEFAIGHGKGRPLIYLAIGSNLPSAAYGEPQANCDAAITLLARAGITIEACSPWYESRPIPASGQPNFVNGVAAVSCTLSPQAMLETCQGIENTAGRVRAAPVNAARILDIDIIDWNGASIQEAGLKIPHPRLIERLFVLGPLRDIAPEWRHPVTGMAINDLIAALGSAQIIRKLG